MKRRLICLVLLVCLVLTPLSALADVPATPNQRLFLRTGPTTKYVSIGHMPQTTSLTAIEYEQGSGVTWVLVEYVRDGQLERAYTGLKRMTVHGNIPWASHLNTGLSLRESCTVYGGPGTNYMTRSYLSSGTYVTLLRYDGAFAYIDFTDPSTGDPSRGWVWSSAVDGSSSGYSPAPGGQTGVTFSNGTLVYVNSTYGAPLYNEPRSDAGWICTIPAGTVLESYSTTSNGFLLVSYANWEGYVDKYCLSLY